MRRYIICGFLLLVSVATIHSQASKVNLKVFGTCASIPEKLGQTVTLEISVDKNKCDPETGFISIEDVLHHFRDALKARGLSFSEFERSMVDSKNEGTKQTEVYSYNGTEKEVDAIVELAQNQEIRVKRLRNRYEERTLEGQDETAICALEDATQRAEHIAKALGYENCLLRSVDDETSDINSFRSSLSLMSVDQILGGASSYGIIGYFVVW